jgi:hypothetical protein
MNDTQRNETMNRAFDKIRGDLRTFIELSLKEDENSWGDWISRTAKK